MAKKLVENAPSPDSLRERFKDFASMDIIERRFLDPNDPGSLPILLNDEDAACCVNSDHQNKLKPNATICNVRDPEGGRCGRPVRRWFVRWFNLAESNRSSAMRAKGYQAVELSELKDKDDVADLYRQAGEATPLVRRGDRGQEILAKMPLEAFVKIKRLQRDDRMARARSKSKIMGDLAEAAGKELGDEAGSVLHRGGITVDRFSMDKSTLGEEADRG